jgi:3-hydroxyacyl-CoA dehydrogenase/enoyl-CoA hydratase/3-hydroxybutyryl-CoA epimerase
VFEDLALKEDLLRKLEAMLGPKGLLASSTSTLSISGLAESLNEPSRFIGLHVFLPVERVDLVELVVGAKTNDATLAKGHDYARQLGKTPITVSDSSGFFVSRVIQTFIDEAAALIADGLPAALIETTALQAGYPGERVIEATVKGHDRTGKSLRPGLSALATRECAAIPDHEAIEERFLYAQCADVLRCAVEGVIHSAAEINTGAVKACGFPAWTGGPLRFIAETGLDAFITRANALAASHGPRFALPVADSATLSKLLAKLSAFDTPYEDKPR